MQIKTSKQLLIIKSELKDHNTQPAKTITKDNTPSSLKHTHLTNLNIKPNLIMPTNQKNMVPKNHTTNHKYTNLNTR
jgi:hypothetical protein